MSFEISLPFLSLSPDSQLMIYEKVENTDVIRLSQTCSFNKKFIEDHTKILSSRPYYGDKIMLQAAKDKVGFQIIYTWHAHPESLVNTEDDNSIKKLTALSVYHLFVKIDDSSSVPQLLNFLKQWKPVSIKTSFELTTTTVSSMHITEMNESVRSLKLTTFCADGSDGKVVPALKKDIKNTILFETLEKTLYVNDHNIFADLQHFIEFSISTTTEMVVHFLTGMSRAKEKGNLKKCSFFVDVPFVFFRPKEPFLLYEDVLIESKLLYSKKYVRMGTVSIHKMTLNNNFCALIQEHNTPRPRKLINIRILEDDDRIILHYLLEMLHVSPNLYTEEKKEQYLAMNDEERFQKFTEIFGEIRDWLPC